MMTALIDELRESGALTGDLPPMPASEPVSRWVVALQVGGAWLAALFLLIFVGLGAASWVRSGTGWMVIGVLATGGAALGLRAGPGMVGRQFLLALSLAGQGAFALGVTDRAGWRFGDAWWAVALFEVVVMVAVNWGVHRLLAALLMLGALQLALTQPFGHDSFAGEVAGWVLSFYWATACGLWLTERRWRTLPWSDLSGCLATALLVYCLLSILWHFALDLSGIGLFKKNWGIGASLVAISGVYLAILGRPIWVGARGAVLFASLLGLCAATWQAPGIVAGLVAMVSGFGQGRRWLFWLGGIVMLAAIGGFYYSLQINLLQKSGLLGLAGLILIALRAMLRSGERQ